MKNSTRFVLAAGLILAVLITNCAAVIRDGRRLDSLRSSVLRLHILAESDSLRDQQLKLLVRDAILSGRVLDGAESLEEAEAIAMEKLPEIRAIAERTLRSHGCMSPVTVGLENVKFDERVYGDITMPAGEYRALRIQIGSARGHNWWCVMYPPLCLPAAVDEDKTSGDGGITEDKSAEELFTAEELDIMYKPKKYRVRFAIWDELKKLTSSRRNGENDLCNKTKITAGLDN